MKSKTRHWIILVSFLIKKGWMIIMKQNMAREIVASLSSLYPLTEVEAEAINTLLEPKEVKWNPEDEADLCPCCGYGQIYNNKKFCDACGQPLLLD